MFSKITKFISPDDLEKLKSIRSSIIPFTIVNNSIWFLVGVDKNTGEITDLGGGVKKNENNLIAGYREFNEETKGIFGCISDINLNKTVALIDYKYKKVNEEKTYQMSTLFIPIDNSYTINTKNFSTIIASEKHKNEIEELLWIKDSEFEQLLQNKHLKYVLWQRIRSFYKNINFIDLVGKLKYKYNRKKIFLNFQSYKYR